MLLALVKASSQLVPPSATAALTADSIALYLLVGLTTVFTLVENVIKATSTVLSFSFSLLLSNEFVKDFIAV